jgi:hypothetical protein
MKIIEVEFLDGNGAVVGILADPQKPPTFRAANTITAIRVTFNKELKPETVTAGDTKPEKFSFLVEDASPAFVPGSIIVESPAVIRFEVAGKLRTFAEGDYSVTLFGNVDATNQRPAITDTDGVRLDGEPFGLPSGDDAEGGDFQFKFTITC